MNDQEAAGFASRYKNIWRGGPSVEELKLFLQPLDAGTIGTMLVRLARDTEDAPSIAKLWRSYNALHTPANDPIIVTCERCEGSGWLTSHTDADGYRYAQPCHCTHGNRTAKLKMEHSHPWPAARRHVELLALPMSSDQR
jgi:hypothetical protein